MFNENYKKLFFSILVATLFGCNGEGEEAKKLGFSSVNEMIEAHAKGWHTQQRYYTDNPSLAKKAAEEQALATRAAEQRELAANKKASGNDEIPDPSKVAIAKPISDGYEKINSMILALRYTSNPFEIREKNIGKRYETRIRAFKFIDEGSYALILDDATGFFCRMKGSEYGKHNRAGQTMVVRGTLAELPSIGIGLDDCTYVSNDANWKAE